MVVLFILKLKLFNCFKKMRETKKKNGKSVKTIEKN